jgi:Tn3 transposase DDE domain
MIADAVPALLHCREQRGDLATSSPSSTTSGYGRAFRKLSIAVKRITAFRVKTEAEQHIWNECSRLIANAVIYYNTLLLSRVYEQKLASGDQVAADIVKAISPNAWQHVHPIGAFDFAQTESEIDIDARSQRAMMIRPSGIRPYGKRLTCHLSSMWLQIGPF